GWVIADSSQLGPRLPEPPPGRESEYAYSKRFHAGEVDESRRSVLCRLGWGIYGIYGRMVEAVGPPQAAPAVVEPFPADQPLRIEPVVRALHGKYGASTLISPGQRSVTLFSAIPVRSGRQVVGAVLVSGTTLRILGDLYQV